LVGSGYDAWAVEHEGHYRACGFRQEGICRQAGLYPDGWKDFILMAVLQAEYVPVAPDA
jgi:hypothetical protein